MSDHYLHLVEKRDAILSTARMSPAARARAMGRSYRPAPAPVVKDQTPVAPRPRKQLGYKGLSVAATKILNAVAEAYKVTAYALVSPLRDNRTAYARFAVALLLRERRDMHYSMIGRCLRRDHTTCIDAVRRGRQMLATDPAWAERYRAAEHALDQK